MACGHARAAIANHTLRRHTVEDLRIARAKIGDRDERAILVELRLPIETLGAGNVTGHRIERFGTPRVACRCARVYQTPTCILTQAFNLIGIQDGPALDACRVRSHHPDKRRFRFARSIGVSEGRPSSVNDGNGCMPDGAEHPPRARRRHPAACGVVHDNRRRPSHTPFAQPLSPSL